MSETWVWDRQFLHILGGIPVAILIRWIPFKMREIPLNMGFTGFRIVLAMLFLLGVAGWEFFNIHDDPEFYWKSFVDVSFWAIGTAFWYWIIRRL
jgi:hypothetical protein